MKKYFLAITAICALLFSACSRQLDIPQKGVVAYETYYTTDEAAEAALVNVYAKMVQNVFGSIGNWNPYFFMLNYSADDVFAACELGITTLHLHARNDDGTPSYNLERYAEIIERIRKYEKDLVICVSLTGRNVTDFEKRTNPLHLTGILKPDMGSLTLSSLNFNKQASNFSQEQEF
mgnify:CR=1 FL=1